MIFVRPFPPLVNSEDEINFAGDVAATIVGEANVNRNSNRVMGSEDFAYMLEKIPGSYIWLGSGEGKSGCMLHNTKYDFNDNILPLGVTYWEQLVKSELPLR